MPESPEELKKFLADLAKLTPNRARQDHYNEIRGLLMSFDPAVSGPVSEEEFWKRLKEWSDRGRGYIMQKFSHRYPADKYPGFIENQPPGVVERFDAIADEINRLYQAHQLTPDKLNEVNEEMKKLCYDKLAQD